MKKKFFALLTMLLSATAAFAQFTNTPNIGLKVPIRGSNNWDIPLYYDWTMIDNMLGGQVALPNGLKVIGPVSMPGFTFTSSQIVSGLGYQPLNPANNLSDVNNAATALANLGGIGSNSYQGTWSSSTSYSSGALVNYSGVAYISLQAGNVNNIPSSSPSYWGAFGSGGGGTPGGTNGEIQYNNSGAFGGYPLSNFMLTTPTGSQTITYNTNGIGGLGISNTNAGSSASADYTVTNGTDTGYFGIAGTGTGLPGAVTFVSSSATSPMAFQTEGGPILFNSPNTNITGGVNYAVDSGTANTYIVSPPSCVSPNHDGVTVNFKAANASTGASTLAYCPGSALPLVKNGSTALATGDILAGASYSARYNAAVPNWQLLNSSLTGSSYTLPPATTSVLGGIKPDGTSCTTTAGVLSCSGGGGSLPTASLGQMLTNNNGTTGYAGQANIFYQQSGDTIASIEAACTSACTYVVTSPQTITLAASHAMNNNVWVRFEADGTWTVNGSTFVLSNVQVAPGTTATDHFPAGTASIAFSIYNDLVPVEWCGASATGTGAANLAAIQMCTNAMQGGQIKLSAMYSIAGTLVGKSEVGYRGLPVLRGSPSGFMETVAGDDALDFHGTSGSYMYGVKLDDFSVNSFVSQSGTAAGISSSFNGGMLASDVFVNDFFYDWYLHASPSYGNGGLFHTGAQWSSLSSAMNMPVGYYLDSSDGNGEASLTIRDSTAAQGGGSSSCIGMLLYGSATLDVNTYNFNVAGCNDGQDVNYTGTGTGPGASDDHFISTTVDSYHRYGMYFTAINAADATNGASAITVADARISSTAGTSVQGIYAYNTSGVTITGSQFLNYGIDNVNSTNVTAVANVAVNAVPTVNFSGASGSIASANVAQSRSGSALAEAFQITNSSSNNVVNDNTITGLWTMGLSIASGSNNNTYVGNNCGTGTVTNCISDSGTGNGLVWPLGIESAPGVVTSGGPAAFLGIGPNTFQGWNNATPSFAFSLGFDIPAGSIFTVPTFSYFNGSAWNRVWQVNGTNGMTFAGAVTAPSFTDSGLGVSLPVCTDGSSTLTTTSCNIATLGGSQTFSAPITFTGGVNFTASSVGINAVGFYINGNTLEAISGTAELQMAPMSTATSSNNYFGTNFDQQAAYWTGSVAQRGGFYSTATPAAGSNPLITLNHTFVAVDTITSGGTATGQETWNYPVNFTSTINGVVPVTPIQIAMPTSAITNGTCTAYTATAMTGLVSTSTITFQNVTDDSGVTGWDATLPSLSIDKYPTSGTLHWRVCNTTAAPITPSAITMNVSAR